MTSVARLRALYGCSQLRRNPVFSEFGKRDITTSASKPRGKTRKTKKKRRRTSRKERMKSYGLWCGSD